MKQVFVDTDYRIAIVRPGDQWKELAEQAKKALGNTILFTTDEVLSEFLTSLSRGGNQLRIKAVEMVERILNNLNVRVLPQTRDSFLRGLDLYKQRPDKSYSLTDCISMNAMKDQSITEVLTHDSHFAQEGFKVLITKDNIST